MPFEVAPTWLRDRELWGLNAEEKTKVLNTSSKNAKQYLAITKSISDEKETERTLIQS